MRLLLRARCCAPQNSHLRSFKNPLSHLMAHRKMKRAAVAAAGAAAAAAGQTKLSNVALDDGSAVLAPRADTSAIRDDGSWRVKEVPRCFKTFHDVICGASQHCFRRACHYCFFTTNIVWVRLSLSPSESLPNDDLVGNLNRNKLPQKTFFFPRRQILGSLMIAFSSSV